MRMSAPNRALHTAHAAHRPHEPDDEEPGALPVEPDHGTELPVVPAEGDDVSVADPAV